MIGLLRHRMTLQREVLADEGGGSYSRNYADVSGNPVVYARIETLGFDTSLRTHRMETRLTHRLTLRARADLVPGARLVKGSRAFYINGVIDRENGYVEVLAEEKAP